MGAFLYKVYRAVGVSGVGFRVPGFRFQFRAWAYGFSESRSSERATLAKDPTSEDPKP